MHQCMLAPLKHACVPRSLHASLSFRENACGSWNAMKARTMPCVRLAGVWNRWHAHTGGAMAHPLGFQPCATPPSRAPKQDCAQSALRKTREVRAMYKTQAAHLGHARCPGHQPRAWRWGLTLSSGCLCRRILGVARGLKLAALFLELLVLNQFMNEEGELPRSRAAARGPNTPLTWAKAPR